MSQVKAARNPWLILTVLCLGFFMNVLDTTIVNIAIPSIIDDLHASLDQILWVLNGYVLAYAVLLITAGRLGDLFGQRNLFVIGLAIFSAASAYCGLAPDPTHLVIARVIQGVGGALLSPQTLSMLTTIFPPERRGAAFGIWAAVAGLAAVVGPTLGGFLVTNVGWRWIFWVNVPVGIITLIGAFLIVPDIRPGRRHGLDLPGVLLASSGLFAIVYGLIEGQRYNWGTVSGIVSIPLVLAAGAALMVLFALWERGRRDALVPAGIFADRNFAVMNGISLALGFAMTGMFLPIVIYFQTILGMSAIQAGLTILPMAAISVVFAPFVGRMTDRIGGKYLLQVGIISWVLGIGSLVFVVGPSSSWYTFLPSFLVAGVGMGFMFPPLGTVAMRNVKPELAGAASGVYNTSRQLGAVVGSAVVGAILQNRISGELHDHAVTAAQQLPVDFQQRFIDGFAQAAGGNLAVGGTGGVQQLPPGIPAQLAAQLQALGHQVFVDGYIAAMRPSLATPVAIMILAVAGTFLIRRRKAPAEMPAAPPEPEARREPVMAH